MATATEIATRALRRISVVDALESPAAADVEHAVNALNAMIAAWETWNLTGDTLPLDGRFEQGVTAMLAVRLAEEYGKTPGPVLLRDATDGERALRAAYFVVPKSTFDVPLAERMLNSDRYSIMGAVTDNEEWRASTAYPLRALVRNNANLYEATAAGTSGTVGPSGTGTEISDGTVVWCWRRVLDR